MIYIEQITHPTLNVEGLVSTIKFSSVESNRHSIRTRVHQLRNKNREKILQLHCFTSFTNPISS